MAPATLPSPRGRWPSAAYSRSCSWLETFRRGLYGQVHRVSTSEDADPWRGKLMIPNYTYRAVVTRVIDGDSILVSLDLGFGISIKDSVRLLGIDTPESRTRRKQEKVLGLAAKARIKAIIGEARLIPGKRGKKQIFVSTTKDGKGKFGRILGTLWVNGENVNLQLVAEGHAREYMGGNKEEYGPWTREVDGEWQRWTQNGYIPME